MIAYIDNTDDARHMRDYEAKHVDECQSGSSVSKGARDDSDTNSDILFPLTVNAELTWRQRKMSTSVLWELCPRSVTRAPSPNRSLSRGGCRAIPRAHSWTLTPTPTASASWTTSYVNRQRKFELVQFKATLYVKKIVTYNVV